MEICQQTTFLNHRQSREHLCMVVSAMAPVPQTLIYGRKHLNVLSIRHVYP